MTEMSVMNYDRFLIISVNTFEITLLEVDAASQGGLGRVGPPGGDPQDPPGPLLRQLELLTHPRAPPQRVHPGRGAGVKHIPMMGNSVTSDHFRASRKRTVRGS